MLTIIIKIQYFWFSVIGTPLILDEGLEIKLCFITSEGKQTGKKKAGMCVTRGAQRNLMLSCCEENCTALHGSITSVSSSMH